MVSTCHVWQAMSGSSEILKTLMTTKASVMVLCYQILPDVFQMNILTAGMMPAPTHPVTAPEDADVMLEVS